MMSVRDRDLLREMGPQLMKAVTVVGSDLLAQLFSSGALTDQQKQHIEVIKKERLLQLHGLSYY